MSENKCNCPVCDGYGVDDPREIVNESMFRLRNASDDNEALEILVSLFNKGYMAGFKSAVVERIESDIANLDYMNGKK